MKTVRNIVLLALLTLVVGQIVRAALDNSEAKADRRRIEAEAMQLYEGINRYQKMHGEYPNAYALPGFDRETLEPLRQLGYYRGNVTSYLVHGRLDGYDSPDDRGLNSEFWMELTSAADPSIRLVIAKSDNAPSGGGRWLDGVYLCRADRLTKL